MPSVGSARLDNSAQPMMYQEQSGGMGMTADYSAKSVVPAPMAAVQNRLVIQSSDMSLLVHDVQKTRDEIVAYAENNGGYMVNASTSNPKEAASGTVTIRVDSGKIKEALNFFRSLSVKVVSENLQGYDVTDSYVDIAKHIALLEETAAKYKTILSQAKEISDITNVTNQLQSIQNQIDSYKGQQESLKKNSELARITIYLSTDELALPYAPNDAWRPAVIVKQAVRSLITDVRNVAGSAIWIAVYGIIWIPALIVLFVLYKLFTRKNKK
jgi:hypothetical protein